MRREQIAFFDVDHTISRHATALWFILACMKRRLISWGYILLVPFLYVLYRFFKLGIETLYRKSLPRIAGISRQAIQSMAKEAFDTYLESGIYPGAVREIRTLKSQGIRVILATSSPFEVVYPLAQYLDLSAADVVATSSLLRTGFLPEKLSVLRCIHEPSVPLFVISHSGAGLICSTVRFTATVCTIFRCLNWLDALLRYIRIPGFVT